MGRQLIKRCNVILGARTVQWKSELANRIQAESA